MAVELDDDPGRIDVAAVHDYLANHSYWAREYRAQGLGVQLVREMVENGPYADIRWVLHTRDAHGLYAKFGFDAPTERVMERLG
jgi:GNAT superfamily N-acetyltransferase